jgi:hypothetical protein
MFMACRHELYSIYQRGLGESVVAAVERVLDSSRDEIQSRPGLQAAAG